MNEDVIIKACNILKIKTKYCSLEFLIKLPNVYNECLDLINKKSKNENYNKKYKFLTGLNQPKKFEVHHIDSNRENNHISNLVMLPKNLHRHYHKYKNRIIIVNNQVIPDGLLCDTKIYNNCGSNVIIDIDILHNYEMFFEVKQACCEWVYFRDCVLGLDNFVFKNLSYDSFNNEIKNEELT